jgi:hypothetical protein
MRLGLLVRRVRISFCLVVGRLTLLEAPGGNPIQTVQIWKQQQRSPGPGGQLMGVDPGAFGEWASN